MPRSTPPPSARWSRGRLQGAASRRGFTLIELLLALAVLVALAAIIIPSFQGLLSNRRLARGGDIVRIEMLKARLAAMRSGRTQMLRFQLGAGTLSVRPWRSAADMTEAADMTGTGSALLQGGTPLPAAGIAATGQEEAQQIELPEGIVVAAARVESTTRSLAIETQTSSEQAAGWSQPLLFYADGTTSTAAVTVRDPAPQDQQVGPQVIVMLRGLTGEPTLTEVQP